MRYLISGARSSHWLRNVIRAQLTQVPKVHIPALTCQTVARSYSSSTIVGKDGHEAKMNMTSLPPRMVQSLLMDALAQNDHIKSIAFINQAASLGKEGSYILEEALTKAMQFGNSRVVHQVLTVCHKHGDIHLSTPLLSTAAAMAADGMQWETLNSAVSLLLGRKTTAIPSRMLQNLLGGLMASSNGHKQVFELLHAIMNHGREEVMNGITFVNVQVYALSLGAMPDTYLKDAHLPKSMISAMERWLSRCRDDGVVSAEIANFILAYSLRADLYTLAGEFAKKALVAARNQYAHSCSFSADRTFSLQSWANDHPLSLFRGFTTTLEARVRVLESHPLYAAEGTPVYPVVIFDLLQQAFLLFKDAAEGKMGALDASDFYTAYWQLEYMARGASWTLPITATKLIPPAKFTRANESIHDLYNQLVSFLRRGDASVAIRTESGYARRILRYLCDELKLQHSFTGAHRDRDSHSHSHSDSSGPDGRVQTITVTKTVDSLQHPDVLADVYNDNFDEDFAQRRQRMPATFRLVPRLADIIRRELQPQLQTVRRDDIDATATATATDSGDARPAASVAFSGTAGGSLYRENYRLVSRPLFWDEAATALRAMPEDIFYTTLQRVMHSTMYSPSVAWLLFWTDIARERGLPLPATFPNAALRLCERSRDVYGLLEIIRVVNEDRARYFASPAFREKADRWRRLDADLATTAAAAAAAAAATAVDAPHFPLGFSSNQWTYVLTIAAKSAKFVKSPEALYGAMTEILALQSQAQRKAMSRSGAKSLVQIFSVKVQRDSPVVTMLVQRLLDNENIFDDRHGDAGRQAKATTASSSSSSSSAPSSSSPSSSSAAAVAAAGLVDMTEVVALSNYLLYRSKQVAQAIARPYFLGNLLRMRTPIFKQIDFLRVHERDIPRLLGGFLASSVPVAKKRAKFNSRIWPHIDQPEGRRALCAFVDEHLAAAFAEEPLSIERRRPRRLATNSDDDDEEEDDDDSVDSDDSDDSVDAVAEAALQQLQDFLYQSRMAVFTAYLVAFHDQDHEAACRLMMRVVHRERQLRHLFDVAQKAAEA